MSKIFRALLISTVATGAALALFTFVTGERLNLLNPSPGEGAASPDEEDLSPEESEALLKELSAQLG